MTTATQHNPSFSGPGRHLAAGALALTALAAAVLGALGASRWQTGAAEDLWHQRAAQIDALQRDSAHLADRLAAEVALTEALDRLTSAQARAILDLSNSQARASANGPTPTPLPNLESARHAVALARREVEAKKAPPAAAKLAQSPMPTSAPVQPPAATPPGPAPESPVEARSPDGASPRIHSGEAPLSGEAGTARAATAPPAATHADLATMEQLGLKSIEGDGVTMRSGSRVAIGQRFVSGERLLQVDLQQRVIVTDRRRIALLEPSAPMRSTGSRPE